MLLGDLPCERNEEDFNCALDFDVYTLRYNLHLPPSPLYTIPIRPSQVYAVPVNSADSLTLICSYPHSALTAALPFHFSRGALDPLY